MTEKEEKKQAQAPEENAEKTKETARAEVDLLKEQLAEQKNRLLRALADFDNFKKRVAADREQFIQFANESLITELLPIIDSFGRAFEAAEKMKAGEEMTKGLALIKKLLEDTLKKNGLAEIVSVGKPFDANFHEAIMQREDKGPEHVVLEEAQKGYTLGGKVIRPSMVIVSKKS